MAETSASKRASRAASSAARSVRVAASAVSTALQASRAVSTAAACAAACASRAARFAFWRSRASVSSWASSAARPDDARLLLGGFGQTALERRSRSRAACRARPPWRGAARRRPRPPCGGGRAPRTRTGRTVRASDSVAERAPMRWCAASSASACALLVSSRAQPPAGEPLGLLAQRSPARASVSRFPAQAVALGEPLLEPRGECALGRLGLALRLAQWRQRDLALEIRAPSWSSRARRSAAASACRACSERPARATAPRGAARRDRRPPARRSGDAHERAADDLAAARDEGPRGMSVGEGEGLRESSRRTPPRAAPRARRSRAPPWPSRTASQPSAPPAARAARSRFQSARTIRAAPSARIASTRARDVAGGEQGVRIAAEHHPDGVFPSRARPDAVASSAPCSTCPRCRRAWRTSLTRMSRARAASRAARRGGARARPAVSRAAVARGLGVAESRRASGDAPARLRPTRRAAAAAACSSARGLALCLGGVALASGELLARFAAACPRAARGDAATRSAARSTSWRALRAATRSPAAVRARLRVSSSSRSSCAQAAAASEARRSASSRASELGPRLGDRARQALLEVGEIARRARLLGREVAALALERGAAGGEVQRGAAVGVEKRVVARDRGLERRQRLAQRVAPRRQLGRPRVAPWRARLRRARERRRPRPPRPAARRAASRRGERVARARSARARVSDALRRPQQLGLLLVAGGARGLALEGRDVALDLRDDVGEAQEVAPRLLELALGEPLLELVLRDARRPPR